MHVALAGEVVKILDVVGGGVRHETCRRLRVHAVAQGTLRTQQILCCLVLVCFRTRSHPV